MTDDLELEARLRSHYAHLDPGPASGAWLHRVERSLDRRTLPAAGPRRWAMLAAAAVLVVVGVVGGVRVLELAQRSAAPSPSIAAASPVASAAASAAAVTADPSAQALADATVDLVGTFAPHGIWAIRGDQLLVSSDSGDTWHAGTAPTPFETGFPGVRAATMLDANVGWMVTTGPGTTALTGGPGDIQTLVVHRTSDGGKSWRSTTLGGNFPGVTASIRFLDNFRGYVYLAPLRMSSTQATVLASSDGGATWSLAGTNATWDLQPGPGAAFAASATGTLVAGANIEAGPDLHALIATSQDGGATWQAGALDGLEGRPGGASAYFAGPPAIANDGFGETAVVNVLPAGTTTHVYLTNDGGLTWGQVGSLPQAAATGVIDLGNEWLIAGANPTNLQVTIDRGATWRVVTTRGLPDGWWAVDGGGIDSLHAWMRIAADNGGDTPSQLMLTADGGRRWHPASFGVPAPAPTPGTASPAPSDASPSPSAASPSPTPAASEPTSSSYPVAPAAWGPLTVAPLTQGPSGTRQLVRWAEGWFALDSGANGAAWTSRDGRAWQAIPAGTFGDPTFIQAAPYAGGLIVFTEDANGVNKAWSSADGRSWAEIYSDRISFRDGSIASDGDVLVAVRDDSLGGVITTNDGLSWALGTTTDGSSFFPNSVTVVRSAAFADSFVAVGSTKDGLPAAWSSADGIHWTPTLVKGAGAARGTALSELAAGRGGLVAMGTSGGTPGAPTTLWVGSVVGGRLVFAQSNADPLGVLADGEGAGGVLGTFTGDGDWLLAYGTRSGSTTPELWASPDGTHWTRVVINGELPSDDSSAFAVGDVIVLGSRAGTTDFLATPAGPG